MPGLHKACDYGDISTMYIILMLKTSLTAPYDSHKTLGGKKELL